MTTSNRSTDVIVVGSGCAGLTAAIAAASHGASVEVHEAAATVGGTSAVSGGVIWIPAHDRCPGTALSVDDAMTYLRLESLGTLDEALVETCVRSGSEMLDFVESVTPLRFVVIPGRADFEPELPGAKPEGRSMVPKAFDTTALGDWSQRITAFPPAFSGVGFDVETGSRHGGTGGARLVAGLLQGALDLGVKIHTESAGLELVTRGREVVGLRSSVAGEQTVTEARGGVVLATGGFEWNEQLVRAFLRGPMHGATSPPGNRGDGLRMAMAVGAELANMSEAWWVPIVKIPSADGAQLRNWGFLFERTKPRSMIVNSAGMRFVNEAASSHSIAGGFHYLDSRHGYVNDKAWLVFDSVYVSRYGAFGASPGEQAPEWVSESMTLDSLAARMGIDPDGLTSTVADWNEKVLIGRDPYFGRGSSVTDGWAGDENGGTPAEQTLGPIDTPPYYAVPVAIGALGTKGGARTDADGRVVHVLGGVVPGLFAVGNAAAAAVGKGYGGAGGTMGPAMVWGYRAGLAAAARTAG